MVSALESALDVETSRLLIDSKIQKRKLVELRLRKVQTNLIRAKQLNPHAELLKIEDRILSIEYNIVEHENENEPKHPKTKEEVVERKNVEPNSVIDELNMLSTDLPSNTQLRKRVNKIEIDSFQQEKLSADITEMAATIKKNAQLFQQKLENDNDLVGSTTDAIQKTAGGISQVGSTLQKYRKESQLGWMFYIFAVIFIVACLFIGMALTQILGKW